MQSPSIRHERLKPVKVPVMTDSVSTDIRTENLPKRSPDCYRLTDLFRHKIFVARGSISSLELQGPQFHFYNELTDYVWRSTNVTVVGYNFRNCDRSHLCNCKLMNNNAMPNVKYYVHALTSFAYLKQFIRYFYKT
jgi:hypothetical protein